ncbi:multidrug ABC transporter ATP-binding protein [Candidatus Saccharibacteria bacterium]|nr:MAG: multidrug ABC transporter ATP-binding protein [Candidatus Saccharibacteria bacterium]
MQNHTSQHETRRRQADLVAEISGLSVVFDGRVRALDDVTVQIPRQRITGLIGPSGSGKTTLIKAIVGRLAVPHGTVSVLGQGAGSASLRHQVAYMSQELAVYIDLTVMQNLKYFARMYGGSTKKFAESIDQTLKLVDLSDKAKELVGDLSGGQKQRVSLAVALVAKPSLLVLDEPTTGLDPVLVDSLWKTFRLLSQNGTTLIISSHSMSEAARCDNLILMRDGKIIAEDTPDNLRRATRTKTIEQAFLRLVGGGE